MMNRIYYHILCLACFVQASSLPTGAMAAEKASGKSSGWVCEEKGECLGDDLYAMYAKGQIVRKQDVDARVHHLFLAVTGGAAILLAVISYFDLKYYRDIWLKNNALVRNINELSHDKEELRLIKDLNFTLRQQVRRLSEELETLQPLRGGGFPLAGAEGGVDGNAAETRGAMEAEADDGPYGKELYERMEHLILSKRLYLDPGFNGEKARKLVHIPRNRFVPFIKRYTGGRFLKYLNKFRLYHAARLLRENPGYSIKAIAGESGIPTLCTFHRLFLEEFGITPAEYRESGKWNESQRDTGDTVRN